MQLLPWVCQQPHWQWAQVTVCQQLWDSTPVFEGACLQHRLAYCVLRTGLSVLQQGGTQMCHAAAALATCGNNCFLVTQTV
jgi:hypothetical protein